MMEERFSTLRGQRLRYLVGGQGKPLVLCHGFLSSAEEFGGRFSELGAHRTLIIPDLPGNGQSPPLRGRHTSGAMADLVFDLLAELEIDTFDVGGLCLGATVACALAKRAGGRAERLVLHTPLLSPDLMRRRYRDQVRLLSRRPMWDGVVWLSRQRWISDLYKRFVIVEGDVDDRTADVNYENQRRANPRAAREWLNDCLRRDDVDVVAARAHATLIIVARHDRLVDVDRLKGLMRLCPICMCSPTATRAMAGTRRQFTGSWKSSRISSAIATTAPTALMRSTGRITAMAQTARISPMAPMAAMAATALPFPRSCRVCAARYRSPFRTPDSRATLGVPTPAV